MKNLFKILLILVVASAFVLFWDSPPEIFVREQRTQVERLPTADSYMRRPVTTKYGEDGALDYVLEAETGLYFNRGDRFELENPLLVAHKRGSRDNPWRLRADQAHTEQRGARVIMTGDVNAWQARAEGGRNEMRTSRLLYLPEDNIARTERKVELKTPGSTTTGVGMSADFNTEVYKLLAQVRGRHYVE